MIIVLGHATVDPAAVPALRPRLAAMMAATRAETGCISYSLSIEDEAAGVLSIAERWVDLAALEAHFASPHMAAFNAAGQGVIRSIDVKRYDVTGEAAL